jgi:hypothetical protein
MRTLSSIRFIEFALILSLGTAACLSPYHEEGFEEVDEGSVGMGILMAYIATVQNNPLKLNYGIAPGTAYPVNVPIGRELPIATSFYPVTEFTVLGNLPIGLGVDPASGAISGTPTAIGVFEFQIQVTDSGGRRNTQSVGIVTAGTAAEITCNPTGIAAGCMADRPFSCANTSKCFVSRFYCRRTAFCNRYL